MKNSYKVHGKEHFYFSLMLIFSLIFYAGASYLLLNLPEQAEAAGPVFLFYILFFFSFLFFHKGIMMGHIRGNGIRITPQQFPDVYATLKRQSELLGLRTIPRMYIIQSGGLLNAFAMRFMNSNYVVIYSDMLEAAYEKGPKAVEFVIAHELGHIKRSHMTKMLWLFPSYLFPLLPLAYSRACEYTCDNIGASLCPEGAREGLVMLAAGKKLYGRVNTEQLLQQQISDDGFWVWFAEKVSTHPTLINRIVRFRELLPETKPAPEIKVEKVESDHNRFMPQSN